MFKGIVRQKLRSENVPYIIIGIKWYHWIDLDQYTGLTEDL